MYIFSIVLEGATQFEQEAAYCDYGLGLNKHSSITHDAVAHANTDTQTHTNRLEHWGNFKRTAHQFVL